MALTRVQTIELFHISFLDALSKRMAPACYVLKGGANLRYFFGSIRYSEDIDLDLCRGEGWSLQEKVTAILEKGNVDILMRSQGLKIGAVSETKQTETTRRWKVGIEAPDLEDLVRTKIEFSNRNGETRLVAEQIPTQLTRPYGIRAPSVQHYQASAATEQKVMALAGRTETQARDVFDLDLLLRNRPIEAGSMSADVLTHAADVAMELPYESYRDQVVSFLEPEAVDLYDSSDEWGRMQASVAEQLLEATQ